MKYLKQNLKLGLMVILVLGLGAILPSVSGPQNNDRPANILGQSSTLLPDGRWLFAGGEGPNGPLDKVSIWNPETKTESPIADKLSYPRAGHTATILSNGTVLILGGVGAGGKWVDHMEVFNPGTQKIQSLAKTNLTPRAYHTATVLTDGRLLVVGGESDKGQTLDEAELWDPRTDAVQVLQARLTIARHGQTSTLLSNGNVLLWGGVDKNDAALNNGELYDPSTQRFTFVSAPRPAFPLSDNQPPSLEASLPQNGAVDVSLDSLIALRFSEPLRVETVGTGTVTLSGPDGSIAVKVIPAEGGMLAFITPASPLLPATTYTLSLTGLADKAGLPLLAKVITFTTAGDLTLSTVDGETWSPDLKNLKNWKTGRPDTPWQKLLPLVAEPGVTAVSGRVLTLDGKPLPHVTLQIENQTAMTDSSGRFLLATVPSGPQVLVIDGKTASRAGKKYGLFEAKAEVTDSKTNVLPYTIWMPALDTAHAVKISSPTTAEVVVTTPLIPGLEVHIPPQTVIRDREGKPVTSVSITPIPVDRPPFPLPPGVEVPIYFTVQPGGANIETLNSDVQHGARIVYPNYTNQPPGSRENFWNYEPEGLGWYVYGQGTVTANKKQIAPDLGVAIYKFTGAMLGGTNPGPPGCPICAIFTGLGGGDPVDLGSGLFVLDKTDLSLPDVMPIRLTRTYRPGDTVSRAFGIGATHSYALALYSPNGNYQDVYLILPGGTRIHYNCISSCGTIMVNTAFQHTETPTKFYNSKITRASSGSGWNLTLKDGTVYTFADSGQTGPMNPLLSIQDRFGNQTTITLSNDAYPVVNRITSPNGRWIALTYDTSKRITQAQDNSGRTVIYTYDSNGRLWKVTDPNNGVTEYSYDSVNIDRMLTIKDARGIVFLTNEYYSDGRIKKQTQADNSTYQFAYTFDGSGNVIQTDMTDPRGYVQEVTFNSSGYPLTDTRALGQPEQQMTTYNRQAGSNFVLSMVDPLNRTTSYTYDAMGNQTSITRLYGTPDAVTTTNTYEPQFNQVSSFTDPLNHTTNYIYGNGLLQAVVDPLGNYTALAYNFVGQPTSITDPLGNITRFAYDSGDLITTTDPLGNQTTRFIDSAGRLLSLTNPLGFLTNYTYDSLNRLTNITDQLQGGTAFNYDPNGNLLSVTDSRNNPTNYTYDNMDRLATRQDPLLLSESYIYDGNSNLATFTDKKQQPTNFTYDALNRRMLATYADSSTVNYTYDAGNRLTQIVDSISGTITMSYDNLDRLTQETTPQGTVNYTYDAANRRATMTVLGQPTVNYTYDNANRLTQITQGTAVVAIVYDNAGRRSSLTLPNNVVVGYTYDNASRITGITYKLGTNTLGNLTYAYDAAGNRNQIGGSWARTGLPQTVSSAVYNEADQLTNWGGNTLVYDANGNLNNDGFNTYTWDPRNRMTALTGPGTVASFQYDPRGRRTNKMINGSSTSFLYDGQNPVQELTGATPSANLLTGLGIDQFFTRTDSTGISNLLTDALGSTLALADSAGTVQTQYTYEPFGNTTVTGAATYNPFQYTGRENDGTGLYYYRARYYTPALQRFIAVDPLLCGEADILPTASIKKNPQLLNAFAYVGNSPLNLRDPLGLSPECQYYNRRCSEVKSSCSKRYYCSAAPYVCEKADRGPFFSCVRQCLKDYDRQNCVFLFGRKDPTCGASFCAEVPGHIYCVQGCLPKLLVPPN